MKHAVHQSCEWIYRGIWKVLTDFFRVPSEPPDLPVASGQHIARFQPAEGFLRYLKFYFWFVLLVTDIGFFVGYVAAAAALCFAGLWWVSALLLPVAVFLIVAPDIVAYVAIHLRYDTTWYVMTDRSLRIRRGVWSIQETTITFENVQNVKVRQGPVQRYFGIANLIVETAGGGGGGAGGKHGGGTNMHVGVIEGIADAPALRDRILARLRASKSAGLGDDEHQRVESLDGVRLAGIGAAHVEALRAIRDELHALRTPRLIDRGTA